MREALVTIPASPWWSPHIHADRRPYLLARNRIRDAVRLYFAEQGFIEVECGALAVSPGNEAHLHAFATERIAPDGRKSRLYLHTSPEFACKKLLAAGEQKIFSLGPVFRNREQGALHACEFTMLEWYRTEEPYAAVIEDCVRLVRLAAKIGGVNPLRFRDRSADAFAEPKRMTVADAFRSFAGIDLLATLGPDGYANRDALAAEAARAGVKYAPDDSWSDIFSRVLVEKIEPNLGLGAATILDEYPRVEAALARAAAHDPRVAERFELYLCGVEIANGFGELTDVKQQRARFEHEMAEKERLYGERYPLDEDFLAALSHMPQASGVALGFDRLVMLAVGGRRIEDVIWTPAPDSGT
jgi:lysyl-tRNA synthetase class 2